MSAGEERSAATVLSDDDVRQLIHDAEVEAGEREGDCSLPLRAWNEGVLAALRELKARRDAGA